MHIYPLRHVWHRLEAYAYSMVSLTCMVRLSEKFRKLVPEDSIGDVADIFRRFFCEFAVFYLCTCCGYDDVRCTGPNGSW